MIPLQTIEHTSAEGLSRKDFISPSDVRWCPGCGDYAILNNMQKIAAKLGISRENFVFVSGIGCSSRFPYYMNTFGFHGIHGRAPAIATGVKCANPELSVWVVTGDGDGLSIGGNHFIHSIRRNVDFQILLFNNRIYGLTKGQTSPTSELGKKTKSTPMGSIEHPINPICVALAAEATFVARALDTDAQVLGEVLEAAARHKGTSFVEIYQNCVIFNDGAFDNISERSVKEDRVLYLEHGKPMIFGKDRDKGIRLNGLTPEAVSLADGKFKESDLLTHDAYCMDQTLAYLLSRMDHPEFPVPMGIMRSVEKETYNELLDKQVADARKKLGEGDLMDLLKEGDTWEVV